MEIEFRYIQYVQVYECNSQILISIPFVQNFANQEYKKTIYCPLG